MNVKSILLVPGVWRGVVYLGALLGISIVPEDVDVIAGAAVAVAELVSLGVKKVASKKLPAAF